MDLRSLIASCSIPVTVPAGADLSVRVRRVTADSRRVQAGDLFVAASGARHRGVDFVPAAVSAGAAAVVVDEGNGAELQAKWGVPVLQVRDGRAAVGPLAAAVLGQPSERLAVIGITGTNGKTTTTILTAQLLQAAGFKAAAVGTTGIWTAEGTRPSQLTTPEPADLQQLLSDLADEGFTHVAIEVSSHALDQHRVAGVQFAAAAWTNLSRDHLDYHGTMQAYAAAKALLFRDFGLAADRAFVNADDDFARAPWQQGLAQGWTQQAQPGAQHQVSALSMDARGLTMTLQSPDRPALTVSAPLIGRHNAENLTAALLVCRSIGVQDQVLAHACQTLRAPRGRLEPVANDRGALVVVDYAHTPDALAQVLGALRPLVGPSGRLLTVFGCGGDRDPGKRPQMGRVAGELADVTLVTSDNPRSEQPQAIVDAIAVGLREASAVEIDRPVPSQLQKVMGQRVFARDVDRGEAIRRAIGLLQAGDVLCIAGKGHETTQTIGSEIRAFDDRAVAQRWLSAQPAPQAGAPFDQLYVDAGRVALLTGGRIVAPSSRFATGLSTDSRSISAGSLFAALPGEKFDGGQFVGEAIAQGAAGVLCQTGRGVAHKSVAQTYDAWIVEVDDPLAALADVMRDHRHAFAIPVVGITGSNGKTTTKELTALALSPLGNVLATQGNFNNRIGVPLTLARLNRSHAVAVVEMGMSIPGEIAELARMGHPQVAVITSIGEAHLLGMGTLAAIADEKGDLPRALGPDGVAILPTGEPLLRELASELPCRVVWFGQHEGDVRLAGPVEAGGLESGEPWQRFVAQVGDTQVEVQIPGLGVHIAHNALAALATAWVLGADLQAAAAALGRYQPVGQRMLPARLHSTAHEYLLLQDCYNANPRSTETALDTLTTLPGPRAAVLGSMLELGAAEHELHRRVGQHAAACGIDLLVTVGPFGPDYAAGTAGSATRTVTCDTHVEAAQVLVDQLPHGTVLIKGSRGARMEQVIAALHAHVTPSTPGRS